MQARRDVFQAIADPIRRQIIDLISYQQLNVNGIAENFKMSRPAISQQVKILIECGLVQISQQGRERYCEPNLDGLQEVAAWADRYRRHWADRFDLLTEVSDVLKTSGKKEAKKKKQGKKKKKDKK